MPPPEPRSRTTSPGRSSATAVGIAAAEAGQHGRVGQRGAVGRRRRAARPRSVRSSRLGCSSRSMPRHRARGHSSTARATSRVAGADLVGDGFGARADVSACLGRGHAGALSAAEGAKSGGSSRAATAGAAAASDDRRDPLAQPRDGVAPRWACCARWRRDAAAVARLQRTRRARRPRSSRRSRCRSSWRSSGFRRLGISTCVNMPCAGGLSISNSDRYAAAHGTHPPNPHSGPRDPAPVGARRPDPPGDRPRARGLERDLRLRLHPTCDVGQPTVSHHLKVLREAGVVTSERRGQWIYYRLAPDVAVRLATIARGMIPGGLIPASDLVAPAPRCRRRCRTAGGRQRFGLSASGGISQRSVPPPASSGRSTSIRASAPLRIGALTAPHSSSTRSLKSGS